MEAGAFASLLEDQMQHPMMSKREFMAFEFTKVILPDADDVGSIEEFAHHIVRAAVAITDALHAELEKERPGETRVG